MHPVLRLYEDILSSAENVEFRLAPLPRFIFVTHGTASIEGKTLNEGDAWQGDTGSVVKPGAGGVTCWRWELARGDQASTVACAPGMITHEKLSAYLETMPKGDCDAWRQRRLPARRLRLSAPPPGAGHPLPDRGRPARRHPRPLDLIRARRRLVRIRARRGVRASS
jgi:hypothetical protein